MGGIANRERHGQTGTRLYKVWAAMLQRCYSPNSMQYRWYGAKGVRVCEGWMRYVGFQSWSLANGYRQGLTIDRIDADGPYSPENCRWVTRSQNALNRGDARLWEAFGEARSLRDWVADPRCLAESKKVLETRLARGWDTERAIVTPPNNVGTRARRNRTCAGSGDT